MEKEKYKKSSESDGSRVADLSKVLGEAWKNLGEEGRQYYVDIYNKNKEQYNKDLETYEKKFKTNDANSIITKVNYEEDELVHNPSINDK